MRKTCCLMALSLLPFLSAPAFAQESDLQQTAMMPDTATTSNLVGQLLGHWVTNDGTTQYYFSPNQQVVIVNLLRRHDNSIAQHQQKLSYEITAVNGNWIQLQLQTPLGWAETRLLHFADDRRSITEVMEVMGHSFRNEWMFVGDRQ